MSWEKQHISNTWHLTQTDKGLFLEEERLLNYKIIVVNWEIESTHGYINILTDFSDTPNQEDGVTSFPEPMKMWKHLILWWSRSHMNLHLNIWCMLQRTVRLNSQLLHDFCSVPSTVDEAYFNQPLTGLPIVQVQNTPYLPVYDSLKL